MTKKNLELSQDERNRILSKLKSNLDEIADLEISKGDLRAHVRAVVRAQKLLREYGSSLVGEHSSARKRILAYFQSYVGEVIESAELDVVSGIKEYARRIRELRVEHGYKIVSGVGREDLKPSQYILLDVEPNEEKARQWKTANRIRKQPGSARSRILAFLKENVGQVVDGDQLAYVAKIKNWQRRVRELRGEEGWVIHTNLLGRADLNPGEYVLETLVQADPRSRSIPEEIAKEVYLRDDFRCVRCGWSQAAASPDDPRYLELHHRNPFQDEGDHAVENLEVRCNVCHRQAHTT